MEERQKQLVEAAEALRTWVHAQKATWSQPYPRISSELPAFASASAGSVALSPAAVVEASPETLEPSAPDDARNRPTATERLASALHGLTLLIRRTWYVAAALAVVLLVAWVVRSQWSGMRARVSGTFTDRREAVKNPRDAVTQRAGKEAASTQAQAAAGATPSGTLQVESNPPGAHVLVDGHDRGVTPLTVEGLAWGSHKVVIRGDQGSIQRTISISSADTVHVNEAIFSGWLHVSSPIDIKVSEGRQPITLDDSNQVLLAPGPHDLRLENRALGVREMRHVDIRPGETTAISLEMPVSHLTVTASEPATVSVDGEQIGETPLTDFAVPVGTRDIAVTSASGVVRHQTLTLSVQPAHVEVDFSQP